MRDRSPTELFELDNEISHVIDERGQVHKCFTIVLKEGSTIQRTASHADRVSNPAPPVSDLREENARLREAATGLSRVLLPIHMQLAERELIEEPVADDVTLFSFMGSGASDRVTVGEYRKALADLADALGDSHEGSK